MSLTRRKVTREDSAETAVTKRSVSTAAANRRRVRAMVMFLMLRASIMPASLHHDSLIKRHVNQTSRPGRCRVPASGRQFVKTAHATGFGLAYDRRNGHVRVSLVRRSPQGP